MRSPFSLAVVALVGSVVNVAFAAVVPAALPVALPVAALAAWAAVHEWRRRLRARRALNDAVGLLAEFRLPLPEGLRHALPDLLQPLVSGYEMAFAEMSRRQGALAERVKRYAFVEMHNEDVVMQVDAQGSIRYVCPSVLAQLGYTPEELRGTRILDKLHPDSWPAGSMRSSAARAPARRRCSRAAGATSRATTCRWKCRCATRTGSTAASSARSPWRATSRRATSCATSWPSPPPPTRSPGCRTAPRSSPRCSACASPGASIRSCSSCSTSTASSR